MIFTVTAFCGFLSSVSGVAASEFILIYVIKYCTAAFYYNQTVISDPKIRDGDAIEVYKQPDADSSNVAIIPVNGG